MTLLELRSVTIHYYTLRGIVRAVEDAELEVREGEKLALVGESGSGKTTLGMAIAGLLPPPGRVVRGRILFRGMDLTRLGYEDWRKIRGREISVVFQDPNSSLNPVMKIGDQIAEVFMAHGYNRQEARQRAIELLRAVGIPDPEARYNAYPHQLSGGMRQRVVIAIAVALKPSLIIADEPTSALDVTIQARILELLKGLSEKEKSSLILITHDLGVAADVADRVAVMYAGHIVEVGETRRVIEEPMHPYTARLLESIPFIHKGQGRLQAIPGHVPSLINPPSGCRFHPRCPYATSECRRATPKLKPFNGRLVACHYPLTSRR